MASWIHYATVDFIRRLCKTCLSGFGCIISIGIFPCAGAFLGFCCVDPGEQSPRLSLALIKLEILLCDAMFKISPSSRRFWGLRHMVSSELNSLSACCSMFAEQVLSTSWQTNSSLNAVKMSSKEFWALKVQHELTEKQCTGSGSNGGEDGSLDFNNEDRIFHFITLGEKLYNTDLIWASGKLTLYAWTGNYISRGESC